MKRVLIVALAALAVSVFASPAFGFTVGRPTGVMITVQSVTDNTVDFDVSMTTTGTSPIGTIGSPVGFFGNLWSYQYTFFGWTVTNRYVLMNPSLPAINYGDGSTLDATVLPMVAPGPPNVYTGNFMHTYPGPGTYTATAGVFRFIGPVATVTPPPPGNGNLVTLGTGTTFTFHLYLLPTFTSPTTIQALFLTPYVLGVTNQTDVNVARSVLPVPTLPPAGLLLLALVLAAGGVFLLRR